MKPFLILITALALAMVLIPSMSVKAEEPDIMNLSPFLSAVVDSAKQHDLSSFRADLDLDTAAFSSQVLKALGIDDWQAVFSAQPAGFENADAPLTLTQNRYGANMMFAKHLGTGRIEVTAEIYKTDIPDFVLTEQTAAQAQWLGSAVFELIPSTLSPYGYTLFAFVFDDSEELSEDVMAFAADDLHSFESNGMGLSLRYPSFMQMVSQTDEYALFSALEHPTQSTLEIIIMLTERADDIIPSSATYTLHEDMGYTAYTYEANGKSHYALRYETADKAYFAIVSYLPSQGDVMQPYLECIENAFVIYDLFIG